jgi:hypothetical protein
MISSYIISLAQTLMLFRYSYEGLFKITRQWSFAAGEMSGVKKVLFIYDSDFEDSRHDM